MRKVNNFLVANLAVVVFVAACLLSESAGWLPKTIVGLCAAIYFVAIRSKLVRALKLFKQKNEKLTEDVAID